MTSKGPDTPRRTDPERKHDVLAATVKAQILDMLIQKGHVNVEVTEDVTYAGHHYRFKVWVHGTEAINLDVTQRMLELWPVPGTYKEGTALPKAPCRSDEKRETEERPIGDETG
jgi:hypothetical protein